MAQLGPSQPIISMLNGPPQTQKDPLSFGNCGKVGLIFGPHGKLQGLTLCNSLRAVYALYQHCFPIAFQNRKSTTIGCFKWTPSTINSFGTRPLLNNFDFVRFGLYGIFLFVSNIYAPCNIHTMMMTYHLH